MTKEPMREDFLMYSVSIPMALVDYIPVVFFGIAAILLQKDLYNKMQKDVFALFAAGTVNIFMAGFLKATWKLLYAANICDFQALNTLFLPLQSLGFLLAGLGIVLMFIKKKNVYDCRCFPDVGNHFGYSDRL